MTKINTMKTLREGFKSRAKTAGAPPGPASGFGRERTAADFRARIEWEQWAAADQRRNGHEALAQGHDLARVAYERELEKLLHRGVGEAKVAEAPRGPRGTADPHAAHELVLYIQNTSDLSPDGPRGQGRDVLLNALRKWRKGTYDPELAVKLFGYLVETGAKRYAKEFGSSEREWSTMFNVPTRQEAARQLEASFRSSAENGEYDHVDVRTGAASRGISEARPRATGPWHGSDANERAYNRVHNGLVNIIIDGSNERSPEILEKAKRVLADLNRQTPPKQSRISHDVRINQLRRMIHAAEEVVSGRRAPTGSGSGRGPALREASRGKKPDQRTVDFFYEHAGYGYGPGETPEQGRKRGAIALAKAEQEATARGWRVEWSEDPEGWDSLGDIDPDDVREMLQAVLYDEDGNVIGSLGSIVNPDRNYGRVVEAELALEALSSAGVAKRVGEHRTREASRDRPISMTFGVLPPFEEFERDIRRPDPDKGNGEAYWPPGTLYPMELTSPHEIELAESFGLEEFEAERQLTGRNTRVRGFRDHERAIYDFLEFLADRYHNGDEEAGDLASSIMNTLGYEWI